MTDRRILNACGACGRQYEVAHLESGARVLCQCGERFGVQHKKSHAPRALQCSACGGNLRDGARKCDYCEAEVTLDELRLDSVCPICAARMASDACFCMECGTKIEPQALTALPEDLKCPRCDGGLRTRALAPTVELIECTACAGLWLNEATFGALCSHANTQELALRALQSNPGPAAIDTTAEGGGRFYLPCPFCKELMVRRNYAKISGIIIDQCREHGVWLDHRELEKILDFVRKGGLERSQERDMLRLKEQQRRAEMGKSPPNIPVADIGSMRGSSRDANLVDALRWIGTMFFG